jgi:hypothetical protein
VRHRACQPETERFRRVRETCRWSTAQDCSHSLPNFV